MKKMLAVMLLVPSVAMAVITPQQALNNTQEKTEESVQKLLAIADKTITEDSKQGAHEASISTRGFSIVVWREAEKELYRLGYQVDGYAPNTLYVKW